MSLSTSSAEPLKLLQYTNTMVLVEDGLAAEANRLRGALEHFEATCREGAFRLHVSHVADPLVQYAQQARVIDWWVRDVAIGFQMADGGGLYGPIAGSTIGLLWGGGATAAGGDVRGIADAARQWLLEHADEFTDKAALGRALLEYLTSAFDTPAERQLISELVEKIEDLKDYDDLLKDIGDITDELGTARGFTYPGQLIIFGGAGVKSSIIGWSDYLTHLKIPQTGSFSKLLLDSNVLKLSGQSALHEGREALLPGSKLGVAFAVIGIGFTAADNWNEYQDEGVQKVVCGTVVDATLETGLSTIGTVGGAFAGGALLGAGLGAISGGALAPVGVAVGSKVGGLVGGMAGDWVAEQIQKTKFDEWATDKLDEGVDWVSDKAGDALADASEATGEALADASAAAGATLGNAAASIEHALAPAVQSVARWF